METNYAKLKEEFDSLMLKFNVSIQENAMLEKTISEIENKTQTVELAKAEENSDPRDTSDSFGGMDEEDKFLASAQSY